MCKVNSVYQIFHFQRTCICPSFGIAVQHTLKVVCLHLQTVRRFFHAFYFPSEMLIKNPRGHILLVYVLCFESVLYVEICSSLTCEHLSFKVLALRCCALWKGFVLPLAIKVYTCKWFSECVAWHSFLIS